MNKNYLLAAGLLLGIGLGGFVDGILFHQILQAHNMLSNVYFPSTLVNAEINMFWDGLFHAFTWITTVVGVFLLWKGLNIKQQAYSVWYLVGLLFTGWGIFNLVEGTLDHQIFQLHHVIQRATTTTQFYSDILFLISGVLFCIFGMSLAIKNRPRKLAMA
ncbi:DUF2243 domain-containing protein [Legionella jordanis]|uniref:Transmembrane protein n=1 Tax=Legionella jordanis TaxID=456 RepID=A0A0W0VFT1_9GAMM|nr:DUF2243 domain-containing protein [Legionella jordanis]KTD19029.1 hypothetical protein Ljor_0252 [Legionella jordanis]RMX05412.1 DUF2243 domain-containing protein [Legionella jordanis]RMX19095.1 DUF2243 domain-containing protein [Legionella jordanis]VEH13132.1 Predicted membrane protein [Legionella jordanis]